MSGADWGGLERIGADWSGVEKGDEKGSERS